MRATVELLPSPLMGEGAGGGEDRTSSPPSPARGEGVLTYPCQPNAGGPMLAHTPSAQIT
jgi:hypothetical protein